MVIILIIVKRLIPLFVVSETTTKHMEKKIRQNREYFQLIKMPSKFVRLHFHLIYN